jgi:hypothetical protein
MDRKPHSAIFFGEGPRRRCYGRTAALRLIVQPCDADERWLISFFIFPSNGAPVEWNWQGKTDVLGGKTCPSASLSTTNFTWTDPGSNPVLRGGRQATNRLSHGTAFSNFMLYLFSLETDIGRSQGPELQRLPRHGQVLCSVILP